MDSRFSLFKKCDMSIQEMKEYLELCLQGAATIPQRKEMLTKKAASAAGSHSGTGGERGLY